MQSVKKEREREIEDQPAPIFRSRERWPWLPSCFLGVFLGVDTVAGSASRSIFLYSAAAEPSTASGDPSTPARGLDDDGRAQMPPWLLRSSRRAGGARHRLHLRWRWVGARLAPGSSAARCSVCRKKSPWRGDVLAFYRHT